MGEKFDEIGGQDSTKQDIHDINQRLDKLERMIRDNHQKNVSWGNSVWVLVPVAAIIMWGLTQIFN